MRKMTKQLKLDVYQFFDEENETINDHKNYMNQSLANNSKNNKQKINKIGVKINKWHKSVIKTFTYNQFMNQYKNVVKTNYPFLPIKQIIEKTRKLWNRFKQSQRNCSQTNHSRHKSLTKNMTKSSLKSKSKTSKKEIQKKVSFDLSANELLNKTSKSLRQSEKKSKDYVSKYIKSLDIICEKSKTNSQRPKASVPKELFSKTIIRDHLSDLFEVDL
jgi:hypothetical protein